MSEQTPTPEDRTDRSRQIERNMIRCQALMVICVYGTTIALLVVLFIHLWRGTVLSLWALLSAVMFMMSLACYFAGGRLLRIQQDELNKS